MAGTSGGGSAAATALPSAGAAPSSQATALLGEVSAGFNPNSCTAVFTRRRFQGFHVGFCRAVSVSCQQQMTVSVAYQ